VLRRTTIVPAGLIMIRATSLIDSDSTRQAPRANA
jgi:hypothetical protein